MCMLYPNNFILLNRQLEAIIRISESLAKMRLAPFASDADVDEALRLFQVSTLDAAMSGNLAGRRNILANFILDWFIQENTISRCLFMGSNVITATGRKNQGKLKLIVPCRESRGIKKILNYNIFWNVWGKGKENVTHFRI